MNQGTGWVLLMKQNRHRKSHAWAPLKNSHAMEGINSCLLPSKILMPSKIGIIKIGCGDPAISLHSHHVSLVQWTNPLLPVQRNLGQFH